MNAKNETILVVEDNVRIRNFITYVLKEEGFSTLASGTAQGALSAVTTQHVDLMLLDLGLPDFDGMEVISKVREWSDLPIIIVSARDQDKEKASALDAGADDYLTKPFSATELLARIRVAIRHLDRIKMNQTQPVVKVGEITVDFDKHLVTKNSEPIHLTPMEYNLLTLLFKNAGKVLTTQYILKEIYGVGYGTDTQALRTLMAGLRRKIETVPAKPKYIMTEIGVGYRLTGD